MCCVCVWCILSCLTFLINGGLIKFSLLMYWRSINDLLCCVFVLSVYYVCMCMCLVLCCLTLVINIYSYVSVDGGLKLSL